MSTKAPVPVAAKVPRNARVAIAAARFNAELVDTLLEGCIERLKELGVDASRVVVERVPGAFELPLAAQAFCETKRYAAVICLGCVVKGDTPHFDFVAGNCSAGIARVSLDYNVPVIFGVLTTNTERQAWDRAGGKHSHAGRSAAEAAVEMMGVMNRTGVGRAKAARLVNRRQKETPHFMRGSG